MTKMNSLCITEAIQGRTRVGETAGYHHMLAYGTDSRVMEQFYTGIKAKWKGQTQP